MSHDTRAASGPGHLAVLLVEAIRELSAARAERDAYRVITKQAIHLLHDRYCEITRLKAARARLLDERRGIRAEREDAA